MIGDPILDAEPAKPAILNKATRARRAVDESIAQVLAQLDRKGRSMAQIQIEGARYVDSKA